MVIQLQSIAKNSTRLAYFYLAVWRAVSLVFMARMIQVAVRPCHEGVSFHANE
jgi:hypothetical protein